MASARSMAHDPAISTKSSELAMTDRITLGKIGLMLGAATIMVMMIGAFVVTDHLTGRMQIDDGVPAVSLPLAAR
jgi:hypothetical protein